MGTTELMPQLPMSPDERAQLLVELAEHEPEVVRTWVEQHPRNLMAYHGWSVEPFHQQGLDDALEHQRTFWLAPRGSGKSTAYVFTATWASIARPEVYTKAGVPYLFPDALREIGPHNIRIAITSNSAGKAEELTYQAKQVLLSDRMALLYGNLEGGRWQENKSDTALRTVNLKEPTYTALGLGSKITGGHYDLVLADDWVTEDNARTELQRQRLSNFWKFTVSPTVEPWGRVLGTGTRYHPSDWYSEIYDWVSAGVWDNLRCTPALLPNAEGQEISYWPSVFSLEKLYAKREEIGQLAFSTQYQNEVDILEGEFFESKHVERFCKWDELPREKRDKARTYIALDPAIKAGPRADFSVFCVVSFVGGEAYIRRIIRGQWTQHELEQRCAFLCHLYKPLQLGIEVVGGIEWLVQELRRKTSLPVKPLRPQAFRGKDKVGRASQVRKLFEQARVWLEEPTSENGIQRLIQEMMAFPSASNVPGMDDCVDALVWALLLGAVPQARLRRLSNRMRRHI